MNKTIVLTSLPALAFTLTAHAQTGLKPGVPTGAQKRAHANALTTRSIEQSFVKLPAICKNRQLAFQPADASHERPSLAVLALHSQLSG